MILFMRHVFHHASNQNAAHVAPELPLEAVLIDGAGTTIVRSLCGDDPFLRVSIDRRGPSYAVALLFMDPGAKSLRRVDPFKSNERGALAGFGKFPATHPRPSLTVMRSPTLLRLNQKVPR